MGKDKKRIEEEESEEDEDYEEKQENSSEDEDEDEDFEEKQEEDEDEDDDNDDDEYNGEEQSNKKRKHKHDIKEEEENGTQAKKVKKEEDDSDNEDDLIKWQTLEHHGVLFPEIWKRHNIRIKYDGEPIDNLTIYQEEMATYWAQTLGGDHEHNEIYRNNFKTQWLKQMKGTQYKDFEKFDFWPIKHYLEQEREKRLNRTKQEKDEIKQNNLKRDIAFGYAIIDGERERIGGYMVEPPTLFKGRGAHPKAGLMKARIIPEQYTINVGEDAPVPKCHTPGHNWLEIVHRHDATWLGGYKDDTINKQHKYTHMSATAKFKYKNDIKKYERARRLKKIVHKIRDDYNKMMIGSGEKQRQLGTAVYLIDRLALRVGNEKGEDEADTVGCCSLRVEHITLQDGDIVEFDFLGKDSMRYHQEVKVENTVWKNLKSFQKGKKGDTDLFDRIDANDVNQYLKQHMPDLTAKVFRTFNASDTLQKQLDMSDEKKVHKMTPEEKQGFYDNAVKQVAILCNHQKTPSKTFSIALQKLDEKLQIYRDYIKELKQHIEKFKKKGAVKKEVKQEIILERKDDGKHKMFTKKFPDTKEKSEKELENMQAKLKKEQQQRDNRDANKDIALGTSKTNYNDPRVTVSWCKSVDQAIEKPFTKTLRDKFLWAMSIEPEWKF